MKKKSTAIIALTIAAVLFLSGCGNRVKTKDQSAQSGVETSASQETSASHGSSGEEEAKATFVSAETINENGSVATYSILLSDQTTFTVDVTNGFDGVSDKSIDYENATEADGKIEYGISSDGEPTGKTISVEVSENDVCIPTGCLVIRTGRIAVIDIKSDDPAFDGSLISWSSDDELIVSDGWIFAKSQGDFTVVGSYGVYKFVYFVESVPTAEKTYELSENRVILESGEKTTLYVSENGKTQNDVFWKTADCGVATIDQTGEVTAVAPGKTMVSAIIFGAELDCEIVVGGVDGKLDEWFDENVPLYKGVELWDLDHHERGYVTYGRATDSGLWYGGYAYHSKWVTTGELWHQNTNFEVFVRTNLNAGGNDKAIQYYASASFRCPGATSTIKTTLNPYSKSEYDKYYSVFELHVPAKYNDETLKYIRSAFAFKTPQDEMAIMIGGANATKVMTEWWWKDLHYPSNLNEMYYVTASGIYEQL